MAPVQTGYTLIHAAALAGMPVNLEGNKFISRVAEGDVGFGLAVVRGTGTRSCEVPAAAGDFLGFASRTVDKQADLSEVIKYNDKTEVGILEEGEIWAIADETVVEGDPCFYVNGSGGGTPGRVRNDADTAAATAIQFATIESGGNQGDLVKVKIPAAIQT
jgi:hypothetical protein